MMGEKFKEESDASWGRFVKGDEKVLKNKETKTEGEEKEDDKRRMRLMKKAEEEENKDDEKKESKLRPSDGPLDDAMDAYGIRSYMHPVTFLKIYGDSDNVFYQLRII